MRQTIRSRDVASKVERRHPLSSVLVALVAAIATLFGSMMMTAPASASELQVSQDQIQKDAESLSAPTVAKTVTADTENEGNFNLSLSVTGGDSEIDQANLVDIILMVDRSGSMDDVVGKDDKGNDITRLDNLKTAATSFVGDALAVNGQGSVPDDQVRIQLMSFATDVETNQSFTTDAKALSGEIGALEAGGWTRWDLAYSGINVAMNSMRNKAKKIVVFMTDGDPSGSFERPITIYNRTVTPAKSVATRSDVVLNVGINLSSSEWLSNLTEDMGGSAQMISTTSSSEALSEVFKQVLNYVQRHYRHSDVVITDTLSQYVEFPAGAQGQVTAVASDSLSVPSHTVSIIGGKLTITFAKGTTLRPGVTYTFTVPIQATEAAYIASQAEEGYPDTGDAGTGTWQKLPGVYTNDNGASNVAYSVSLADGQGVIVGDSIPGTPVPLPKPVIQVTPVPAEISIQGKKIIDSHASSEYELRENDFKVNLTGTDSKGAVDQTKANDADGNFEFDSLTFTKAGKYEFNLSEVLPKGISTEKVSDGILYDAEDKTVTVTVKLVGKKFEASIENKTEGYDFSFTNVALGLADIALSATKVVLNNDDGGSVPLTNFEFGIYEKQTEPDAIAAAEAGKPIKTAKATAEGNISFEDIEYKQDGVHEYLICEIIPDGVTDAGDKDSGYKYLNGILYDTKCAETTVTVTLNTEKKELVATKAPVAKHTFTNIRIVPIELNQLAVTKSISGRDLVDGEFTFVMVDEKDEVVATGKNDADGAVVFDKLPMASDTGTYEYTVREVVPNEDDDAYDAAITYDDSEHGVSFGVTLNFDALDPENSTFEVTSEPEPVEFKNIYTAPKPISLNLEATKVLEDGTLKEGQFDFNLSDMATGEASVIDTVSNAADGSVAFNTIELTDVDVENGRTLQMSEVIPDGATAVGVYDGIRYDQSLYDIVISVTRDKKTNTLHETVEGADDIVFTNLQLPVVPVDPPVIPETPDTPTTDPVKTPGTTVSCGSYTCSSGGGYISGGGTSSGGYYGPLAKTGANTTLVVALSIALLLLGAAAVVVGKRGSLSLRK